MQVAEFNDTWTLHIESIICTVSRFKTLNSSHLKVRFWDY
jgi:hypothetical protein